MTHTLWNAVKVKSRNGGAKLISGPQEALKFLDNDWEGAKGEFYKEARRNCSRAVENVVNHERARQSFVGAFLDAALPIA